MKLNLSK